METLDKKKPPPLGGEWLTTTMKNITLYILTTIDF